MKPKYIQRYDGKGFTVPNGGRHLMVCCDCGLVHTMVIVSDGGPDIGVAAERNERETRKRRARTRGLRR